VNQAILCGRLVRDPEIRYTSGAEAKAVANYTIAIDRIGKSGEADFIPCVAFGKLGEFAEKYFKKGQRVLVSGRIQTGSYTNKDGQKVYTTDVYVNNQEFADGKTGGSDGNQTGSRPTPSNARTDGFMNIPDDIEDDGLPFN
jgi:single-strand binding protein